MSFDDLKAEVENEQNRAEENASAKLTGGDECPEDHCEREVHELNHPRNSRLGTDPHSDAPETEVVCVHDGIVESR